MKIELTAENLEKFKGIVRHEEPYVKIIMKFFKMEQQGIWPMQGFIDKPSNPTAFCLISKKIISTGSERTLPAFFVYAKSIDAFKLIEADIKESFQGTNKSMAVGLLGGTLRIIKPYLERKYNMSEVTGESKKFNVCYFQNQGLLDYKLPENYKITSLELSDVDQLTAEWQFGRNRPNTTALYFTDMINKGLKTVAVRDLENKLVSYYMDCPFGGIGMLYTVPEYRGKGLAKIVTKELTRQLLEVGIEPFTCINEATNVSLHVHEVCGFKSAGECYFIGCQPKT